MNEFEAHESKLMKRHNMDKTKNNMLVEKSGFD